MPFKPKFDYDGNEFYDEILALTMQGLTDAEIADALEDKFGVSLSPERFCCMKNGNYDKWTKKQNAERSKRMGKVLARGRRKINAVVRGKYLRTALGGGKLKSSSITKRKLKDGDGNFTNEEEIQTVENEQVTPPSLQALATWLRHHDPDWRATEKIDDSETGGDVDVDEEKWIEDNNNAKD